MKYQTLGKTDLQLSQISFGCMSLAEDNAANRQLLQQAIDGGINFFDTADLYQQGANERLLGKAFKGIRNRVVLATKVGNQWRTDGSGWDWNPTKAYILAAAEKSLQRLQTDYIDLYQLHGGTLEDPVDETIEAFEQLKQEGKIRHWGISSIRPNVIRRYVTHPGLASVMLQYSLLDRRPEEAVLDQLYQHKVGVLVRGSLAQGLLLGKAPKPYLDHAEETVAQAATALKKVAANMLPAAAAVRYVLQKPAVTAAILGIRTQAQLEDAFKIAAAPALGIEQTEMLQKSIPAIRYQQHR